MKKWRQAKKTKYSEVSTLIDGLARELDRDFDACGRARIVLVSGWSFDASMWRDVIDGVVERGGDRAAIHCLDWLEFGHWVFNGADCVQAEAHAGGNTLWLGWSLGGTLILEALARGKLCPRQSVLLSTSPRFLQDETSKWMGMPEKNWQALRRQVARAPDAALAGFDSWLGLPAGLSRQREASVLQQGLDWLAVIDQRDWLGAPTAPIHWLFAADDPLVPTSPSASSWANHFESQYQHVTTLPKGGHALPWTQKEYLMNVLLTFSAHGITDV